ncbi:MAG: UDP-4-amino-4,6-dideoxy-N-acetyl-beta-L-altrosamine N-acetyltransferase [Treponema sp.]
MKLTFKNFIILTEEEIELVCDMRNSTGVRTKMYNQDIIPLEQHKKWVTSLKGRTDSCYFLAYADEKILGVVDFTSISADECEWGYYLNEKYINSGYGVVLEYYVLKYAFEIIGVKKLFCAVLDSNKNVYDTHIKYFGFIPDERYSSTKQTKKGLLRFNGLSLSKTDWQNWHNPTVERSLKFFKIEGSNFI